MKNIVIILDPAHGADVKGKCSPNGEHKEYIWSRDRVKSLRDTLTRKGYKVFCTNDSINEVGLSKRKNFATKIEKGSKKLLLSLHNNAAGSDGKWHSARGISIFTTKGVTKSDTCADIILSQFEKDFKDVKIRIYSPKPLGKDFEENFTVLMGADYMGVLIEWLFQDNKEDFELLRNSEMNRRFEASLVEAVEKINDYFK